MRWHIYTVAEANRALPMVARIVEDLRRDVHKLKADGRLLVTFQSLAPDHDEDILRIRERIRRLNADIKRYLDELSLLGCCLRDLEGGFVEFPTALDGKLGYLSWHPGESRIQFWHELGDERRTRRSLPSGSGSSVTRRRGRFRANRQSR